MKIGVIGLGLIGGSIFKALGDKYVVVGVSRSLKEENVSKDYSVLQDCDIVFVCTPMNKTLEILDKLETILSPNTMVTDVCSLKMFVSKKKYSYRFIPSHPMAGTEHSGWEHSFPELFQGAKWVLTPADGDVPDELEKVIRDLGAQIIITTPEEHDKAVALISNLPLIVAQALCANIKNNMLAQMIAASGFRDTTRLALSNVEMANDMLEINRKNIKAAAKSMQKCMKTLLDADYKQQAENLKKFRELIYPKNPD